jgi:hypothetical protein
LPPANTNASTRNCILWVSDRMLANSAQAYSGRRQRIAKEQKSFTGFYIRCSRDRRTSPDVSIELAG